MLLRATPLLLVIYMLALPIVARAEATINGKTARAWVADLKSSDVKERRAAAFTLIRFDRNDTQKHIAALIAALKDEDVLVRLGCASVLGNLGTSGVEAMPALIEVLGDVESRVAKMAGEALVKMRPHSVGPLAKALGSDQANVRLQAAQALEAIGPEAKHAVPALAKLLNTDGEESTVRIKVAQALVRIGEPSVPSLVEALKHAKEEVRLLAATALGEIGADAKPALPALRKAADDPVEDVRRAAADAIRLIEQ
jgi:HEAT repeat protein